MQRRSFQVEINASSSKVWEILWGEVTYPQWTLVFSEGSKAISDWKEGSKILFVGQSGEGMVAIIQQKTVPEYMSFKHIGMIGADGTEDYDSEMVKKWAGAEENYTLTDLDGKTALKVEIDINDEYEKMFTTVFPKALNIVKDLSEQ